MYTLQPVSAILLLFLAGVCACGKSSSPPQAPFADAPTAYPVTAGVVDEASGIADGFARPNALWVIQDSQQPTELYLVSHEGQHLKKVFIKNVANRDWEDLAVSTGPVAGKNYVYIAETGDNDLKYADYAIYRMEEPQLSADTVTQVEKISFRYPDGAHDAEAMFVDAGTKDIYIITKRDAKSRVYRLLYPQSVTGINTAAYIAELPFTGVVAASLSGTRQELLVKTYTNIYYFSSEAFIGVVELLKRPYLNIKYEQEPQGEAICFSNDNSGFFTLSEKPAASAVSLRFYKRK
jgi:hypothetical protein